MITHYIILSSSYSTGKRIAYHIPFDRAVDEQLVDSVLDRINSSFEGSPPLIAVHIKQTDSDSWESVVELDSYFRTVSVINNLNEFIELIRKDRTFKGVDVARYILSKTKCTHTRLEKLTYLCYADYLCNTNKKLFEDNILTFKYGPVVLSVYKRFKSSSKVHPSEFIEENSDDDLFEISDCFKTDPIRSRLLFAEDGLEKVMSIDRTIARYQNFNGAELVAITHRTNSPWSNARKNNTFGDEISDKLILEFHINEEPNMF